jgi:hypothetical protein
MEASGQLHAPAALPSGKEPPVPMEQEAGWAPEPAWTLWSKEKCLSPAGNRTPAVQPVAHRYTDWAIPAPWKILDSTSNRPRPLPSTSFTIGYSLLILPFDALWVYSELMKNKKFWEELIAYFPCYDTYRIENEVSNSSSIVACVFVTAVTFLPSRCLATIGGFLPNRAVT